MPTVKLSVSGLRSHSDEERVEQALEAEPGIFGAIANRQSGCAEVDYEDDEVDIARLIDIIRSTGFEAFLAG